jgi:hypothetical protein
MIEENRVWSIPSNSKPFRNGVKSSPGHRKRSLVMTVSLPLGTV